MSVIVCPQCEFGFNRVHQLLPGPPQFHQCAQCLGTGRVPTPPSARHVVEAFGTEFNEDLVADDEVNDIRRQRHFGRDE